MKYSDCQDDINRHFAPVVLDKWSDLI